MIMCGNKAISWSELSWLKIGKSSVDSSMQSRQTLSTFITGDIIVQWREWSCTKSNIPIWNVLWGYVISISDNHIHVCECSIHFPISAKTFSPKYFVPYEINYFTQSNMDISTSRYMSPPFFLLAPLHTWCLSVTVGRQGNFTSQIIERWWEYVFSQLKGTFCWSFHKYVSRRSA